MRVTLNNVNKAIANKYPGIQIEKDNGCFYVYSDNAELGLQLAGLYQTSIEVSKITDASIEQWLNIVKFVLDDMLRSAYDRQPVKLTQIN